MDMNEINEIVVKFEKERDSMIVALNQKLEEAKIIQNKLQFLSGKIAGYVELSNRIMGNKKTTQEPKEDNEKLETEKENSETEIKSE